MPKIAKPIDIGVRMPAKLAKLIRAQAVSESRSAASMVRRICQAHYEARSLTEQLELPLTGGE